MGTVEGGIGSRLAAVMCWPIRGLQGARVNWGGGACLLVIAAACRQRWPVCNAPLQLCCPTDGTWMGVSAQHFSSMDNSVRPSSLPCRSSSRLLAPLCLLTCIITTSSMSRLFT